jgi:mannosyltransferase OCH1-like enzyme
MELCEQIFFRHCVLYKIGGVYLDIKSMMTKPLGSIINPDPYLNI